MASGVSPAPRGACPLPAVLDALAALEVVEVFDDDATQLRGSVLVGGEPGAQQVHAGLDAAFAVDVHAKVENASGVAQRHADRVRLPVAAQALHGLGDAAGALPGGGLQAGEGRAQVVVGQRVGVDRLPCARAGRFVG